MKGICSYCGQPLVNMHGNARYHPHCAAARTAERNAAYYRQHAEILRARRNHKYRAGKRHAQVAPQPVAGTSDA